VLSFITARAAGWCFNTPTFTLNPYGIGWWVFSGTYLETGNLTFDFNGPFMSALKLPNPLRIVNENAWYGIFNYCFLGAITFLVGVLLSLLIVFFCFDFFIYYFV
jgi:hypothetical protein